MYSTVRIECTFPNGTGTGTGFLMNFLRKEESQIPAIVTNKHVVNGAITGKFIFTTADEEGNPVNKNHYAIEIGNFQNSWIMHPDPNVDLCILPIAAILEDARIKGVKLFYIALDSTLLPSEKQKSDLRAIEDIIMVGYPNGIWDKTNNLPVMRKGITATHPNFDYNDRSQFMIDAACFPGSSGSPVFLFNEGGYTDREGNTNLGGVRFMLLGILFAGPQHSAQGNIRIMDIPMSQREVVVSSIPNNLGFVIKSENLLTFDNILAELESR